MSTARVTLRRRSLLLVAVAAALLPMSTPSAAAAAFVDVPAGHLFEANVDRLARAGITRGCNPAQGNTRYCPDDYVTRGQMAAFLDRALDLPAGTGSFADAAGHVFEANIAALARAGITRGCNPAQGNTRYCPDDHVTRGQMAAFLDRAGLTVPSSSDAGDGAGGTDWDDTGDTPGGDTSGGPDGSGDTGDDAGGASGSGTGATDGTGATGATGSGDDGGTDPGDAGTDDGSGGSSWGGGGGAGADAPGGGTDAVTRTIDVGKDHGCRVLEDATVRCWGVNTYGQLGDGTAWQSGSSTFGRPTPVEVVGVTDADAVTAGEGHSCALHANGTAHCWGSNFHGELGDSTAADHGTGPDHRATPVEVSGLSDAVDIAAGRGHSCALRSGGTVVCWGFDVYGQLGDGTAGQGDGLPASAPTPVAVVGLTDVVEIDAGGLHTCARRADRTVWCWGWNGRGQLGTGSSVSEGTGVAANPTPVRVVGVAGAASISAGRDHTCATLTTGTVLCWGDNGYGQLGDGTSLIDGTGPAVRSSPVQVPGVAGVVSVDAGHAHTCGVGADGTVGCWGWNGKGQLGDGTSLQEGTSPASRPSPVQVLTITDAAALGAGLGHTCAALADASVTCWGGNVDGQLGDGTSYAARTSPQVRSTPVPVALD